MVQPALRPAAVFALAAAFAAACSSGRTAPAPRPGAGSRALPRPPGRSSSDHPAGAPDPAERGVQRRACTGATRTATGQPGPRYWQQYARYRLQAELQPLTKRLVGQRHGDLPEPVSRYAAGGLRPRRTTTFSHPDAKRNQQTPKLGGDRVRAGGGGRPRDERDREGERAGVHGGRHGDADPASQAPRFPAIPVTMDFEWRFRVPSETAPRGGQDGEVWYLSYWYPQVAVYDDVNGWQIDQYLGQGEFYMGYADYDVALTLPNGWLVDATGALQNPAEVLSARTRARLDSARTATSVVRVVTEQDKADSAATARGQQRAAHLALPRENVRDFAWGTSPRYLWDATSAATGTDTASHLRLLPAGGAPLLLGRGGPLRPSLDRVLLQAALAVSLPHMTAMDGPVGCGGMEYPMMTCIGGQWDSLTMYEVVTHEIGHMWFPMMVGSDEKRYTWQDEGLTQYLQSQSIPDFYKSVDDEEENRRFYFQVSEAGLEEPLMKHGDRYYSEPAFGVAGYYKPASVLVGLREILGRDTFERAMREYGKRWTGQASHAVRLLEHDRRRERPGPGLVLEDLVLRDLAAGSGAWTRW